MAEYGAGQALIYPYYTVQGFMDVLIFMVNANDLGKAVKVRFLEGRNSRPVLEFNLYLSPNDVWTGAVTRDANGNAVLRTADTSCTVPAINGDVPLRNDAYANYDAAGSGLERAREGYVEVLEMGTIPATGPTFGTPARTLAGHITHTFLSSSTPVTPPGCAQVAAAWSSGGAFVTGNAGAYLGLPSGGLSGTASLVNVPEGIDYSYETVVLDDVFGTVLHSDPGSSSPGFHDARPLSSQVVGGEVISSVWNRGEDAVSAVLMAVGISNHVSITPVINARTDWVMSFPTWRYYVNRESDGPGPVFTGTFDNRDAAGQPLAEGSSNGLCASNNRNTSFAEPDIVFTQPPVVVPLCWAVNVLSFSRGVPALFDEVSVTRSPNLGVGVYMGMAEDGMASAVPRFGGLSLVLDSVSILQGGVRNRHVGLPAVGFALERYFPGAAFNPIPNYGIANPHSYIRSAVRQ